MSSRPGPSRAWNIITRFTCVLSSRSPYPHPPSKFLPSLVQLSPIPPSPPVHRFDASKDHHHPLTCSSHDHPSAKHHSSHPPKTLACLNASPTRHLHRMTNTSDRTVSPCPRRGWEAVRRLRHPSHQRDLGLLRVFSIMQARARAPGQS